MLIAILLSLVAGLVELLEDAIGIVVPDQWLNILRTALHGTGTSLIQAATYRLQSVTVHAIAVTVDLVFVLAFMRLSVRGIRRIVSWIK